MKSKVAGVAVAACLVAAGAARADEKPGSVYVQCDGQPEAQSLGKTSAQLLGIMLTAGIVGGIVGGPEAPDAGKLLEGDKGAEACKAALALNKDEVRGARLELAKAIHEIEAAKYDAAIADATSLTTVAPVKSGEAAFRHGLGLSGMEIQAAALARQGHGREAEDLALKMAAVAPYDLLTTLRAATYVNLTPEMSPAKRAYYDQAARLWSPSLTRRALAEEWAGDYAGAAASVGAFIDTVHGFLTDQTQRGSALLLAHQSVDLLLAGDIAGSNALAEVARTSMEKQMKEGTAEPVATETQEFLDFQAVGRQLAEGHAGEARAAFAGRSRWLAPSPPVVAELSARLRAGAPAAQLTGALAVEPAKLREEGLSRALDTVASIKPVGSTLFKAVRMQGPNPYGGLAGRVWRSDKSSLVVQRRPNSTYVGEAIALTTPYTDQEAAGEALLLHAALRARDQGKAGFILQPARDRVWMVIVRYGNPGEPDFPKSSTFVAQKVIDDLSVNLPQPGR